MFKLPVALYPTCAAERLSEGLVADMFGIDMRHVRASNSFTRDLLISRAIEEGYVKADWTPRQRNFSSFLDELSSAVLGHWSKLLSDVEREERLHVLFVIRVQRRKYFSQERRYHV